MQLIDQIIKHKKENGKNLFLIKWINPNNKNDLSWEEPINNIKKWITKFLTNKSISFELEWDFLSHNNNHVIQNTENILDKNHLPILWNQKVKYLGCWLTNNPDDSLIDPTYNFNIFIATYQQKNLQLNALSLTHQYIDFTTKINLAKAFSLPYYIIYSQIIPLIPKNVVAKKNSHY